MSFSPKIFLSHSLSEKTTVRSNSSETDFDQMTVEQLEEQVLEKFQKDIIKEATFRVYRTKDSNPSPGQLNISPNPSLETDFDNNLLQEATTTAASSNVPALDLRHDDGYSNTVYLENISAAVVSRENHQNYHSSKMKKSIAASKPSSTTQEMRQERRQKKIARRKEAFANLVQHLNRKTEEEEKKIEVRAPRSHSSGRLKSVICREYLPEHVHSKIVSGSSGTCSTFTMPSSRVNGYYGSTFCCCTCAMKNCGNCQLLKIFICATLLLSILFNLTDRCSYSGIGDSVVFPNNLTTLPKIIIRNGTTTTSSIIDNLTFSKSTTNHLTTLVANSSSVNKKSGQSRPSNNCLIRDTYIVLLALGLIIYLSIFYTYTCKLVVHYPTFPWFLSEAIAVGLFSVLLFIASTAGLILERQTAANIVGLVDALLGFVIACSAYLCHLLGLMPMFNISVDDDADSNQINRILGEKHFSRVVKGH